MSYNIWSNMLAGSCCDKNFGALKFRFVSHVVRRLMMMAEEREEVKSVL